MPFEEIPMTKTCSVLFGAFLLGCAAASTQVMAGSNCHGSKKATPTVVVVEEEVVVEPAEVIVKEKIKVDGGSVKVTEEVDIYEAGGPVSVGATRKDAWKAYRATVAEAKAERRAGRFARKAADAAHEAAAEAAVKSIYAD
jgi:hypothetical protein